MPTSPVTAPMRDTSGLWTLADRQSVLKGDPVALRAHCDHGASVVANFHELGKNIHDAYSPDKFEGLNKRFDDSLVGKGIKVVAAPIVAAAELADAVLLPVKLAKNVLDMAVHGAAVVADKIVFWK